MKSPEQTSLQDLFDEAESLIRRSAPANADESDIQASIMALHHLVMQAYIVGNSRRGTNGETIDMIAALKLLSITEQAKSSSTTGLGFAE